MEDRRRERRSKKKGRIEEVRKGVMRRIGLDGR